jgi:hypothetical protein
LIVKSWDIAPVWAGHRVPFCLFTHGGKQFVTYYDTQRRTTVAERSLDSDQWKITCLAEQFPLSPDGKIKNNWAVTQFDSHNYWRMGADEDGHLHLSGNMHGHPLRYLRTTNPLDSTSFEKLHQMTGENEKKATYPDFFHDPAGRLVFLYRDGQSGNGVQIFNVYDHKKKLWSRLTDQPLFSGEGDVSAYYMSPVQDKKGTFHVAWIWRETGAAETCFNVCYMRSKDLVHWETSDGKPLTLPVVRSTSEVVDPVPVKGGILNNWQKIGFDSQGRVLISYFKYDDAGKSQIYVARRETDGWKIHQISNWDYRWAFKGGGAVGNQISTYAIEPLANGKLLQKYWHVKHGFCGWILDADSLKVIEDWNSEFDERRALSKLESTDENMHVQLGYDFGNSNEPGYKYVIRWETRPSNRDKEFPGPPPKPTMLRVYKVVDSQKK